MLGCSDAQERKEEGEENQSKGSARSRLPKGAIDLEYPNSLGGCYMFG